MKLKDIKTRDQFYSFADVWYQRTLRLSNAFKDESKSDVYRLRAFLLFKTMTQRVMKLNQIAIVLSQPKPRFEKGC